MPGNSRAGSESAAAGTPCRSESSHFVPVTEYGREEYRNHSCSVSDEVRIIRQSCLRDGSGMDRNRLDRTGTDAIAASRAGSIRDGTAADHAAKRFLERGVRCGSKDRPGISPAAGDGASRRGSEAICRRRTGGFFTCPPSPSRRRRVPTRCLSRGTVDRVRRGGDLWRTCRAGGTRGSGARDRPGNGLEPLPAGHPLPSDSGCRAQARRVFGAGRRFRQDTAACARAHPAGAVDARPDEPRLLTR